MFGNETIVKIVKHIKYFNFSYNFYQNFQNFELAIKFYVRKKKKKKNLVQFEKLLPFERIAL